MTTGGRILGLLSGFVFVASILAPALTVQSLDSSTPYVEGMKPLNKNAHVACGTCEVLVGVLTRALQAPNQQLKGRLVEEVDAHGQLVKVPYVQSVAYAQDLFDILCESPALQQLRVRHNWFGMPSYEYDNLPSYGRSVLPIEPDLRLACSVVTKGRQRAVLAPVLAELAQKHSQNKVQVIICSRILGSCRHKESFGTMMAALFYGIVVQDPAALLRLLPLLVSVLLGFICLAPANWTPSQPKFISTLEDEPVAQFAPVPTSRSRKKHL